jgi:crossover junction endodeoxyribonuclease RuvC
MRILGVDCGSRVTGYGVIDVARSAYAFVACGAIRPEPSLDLAGRLQVIHGALAEVIRDRDVDVAVFESVFHASNPQSALKLGHARGVSLLAASRAGLPVFEYSALEVKSAVTGFGRAEKSQVQQMVRSLLSLDHVPEPHDASDALAVAICHAQSYRYKAAAQGAATRRNGPSPSPRAGDTGGTEEPTNGRASDRTSDRTSGRMPRGGGRQ